MPVSMTHDVKLLYFPFFSIGKNTQSNTEENGARPRLRKKHSQPRPPAKFISPEHINRVMEFIKKTMQNTMPSCCLADILGIGRKKNQAFLC